MRHDVVVLVLVVVTLLRLLPIRTSSSTTTTTATTTTLLRLRLRLLLLRLRLLLLLLLRLLLVLILVRLLIILTTTTIGCPRITSVKPRISSRDFLRGFARLFWGVAHRNEPWTRLGHWQMDWSHRCEKCHKGWLQIFHHSL